MLELLGVMPLRDKMSRNEMEISRVIRSKEEAKASYDKLSKWYDLLAGRFERRYRDIGLQKLSAKKGEIVLEIGFGTGDCLLSLAQAVGNSGQVYGIDISEGMCRITGSRLEKTGLVEQVTLICDDAAKLPFKANSFDAIFMSFTLELFDTPEIPTVLGECQRVLRSSGRLCVVGMSKKGASVLMRLYECAHRKFPRYLDCRPIFIQESLEGVGFQIIEATKISMWSLPIEIVLAKKA